MDKDCSKNCADCGQRLRKRGRSRPISSWSKTLREMPKKTFDGRGVAVRQGVGDKERRQFGKACGYDSPVLCRESVEMGRDRPKKKEDRESPPTSRGTVGTAGGTS